MAVDWLKIKTEYINGDISYRKLAEKYSIPFPTLRDRAVGEGWKTLRNEHHNDIVTRTEQKTIEKISDSESEIAAIKSRLKLRIYKQLEERMNAENITPSDFRRLVQSYKDMCDIREDGEIDKTEGVTVIIDV